MDTDEKAERSEEAKGKAKADQKLPLDKRKTPPAKPKGPVPIPENHFTYSLTKLLEDTHLMTHKVHQGVRDFIIRWNIGYSVKVVDFLCTRYERIIDSLGLSGEMNKRVGPQWRDNLYKGALQEIVRPVWWISQNGADRPWEYEHTFGAVGHLRGARMYLDMIFTTWKFSEIANFGFLKTVIVQRADAYQVLLKHDKFSKLLEEMQDYPEPFQIQRYDSTLIAMSKIVPGFSFVPYTHGSGLRTLPCIGDSFYRQYSATGTITYMKLISERTNLLSVAFNILFHTQTLNDYKIESSGQINVSDFNEGEINSKTLSTLFREFGEYDFTYFSDMIATLYTGVDVKRPAANAAWKGLPGDESSTGSRPRPSGGGGPALTPSAPPIEDLYEETPTEVSSEKRSDSNAISIQEYNALREDVLQQSEKALTLIDQAKTAIASGSKQVAEVALDAARQEAIAMLASAVTGNPVASSVVRALTGVSTLITSSRKGKAKMTLRSS